MKLTLLIIMVIILIVIHETGHFLAYKALGIPAHIRKSLIAPGISPNERINVTRVQGIIIALSGFVFSTLVFVIPSILFYTLWKALLVGSIAGSIADFLWAVSMFGKREITID